MACRTARHEFFARLAQRLRVASVAMAHHSSDQAELFLMRMLRGAGGRGLAGMSEKDPSPIDAGITLIRPLLEISGKEIRDFAGRHDIDFREDASNLSRVHERNRARHEALPLLERIFERSVERGALQSMRIIGDETAFVEAEARKWLKARRRRPFDKLHPALKRALLCLQLLEFGIDPRFDWIESLGEKRGSWISITPSAEISRDENGFLQLRETKQTRFEKGSKSFRVAPARGSIEFRGLLIRWQRSGAPTVRNLKATRIRREVFDADQVGDRVTLRHWQPGDRFQPIGMDADLKLQDWFTNLKIPRAQRRKLVLALSESGQIFWVEGCRIGDRFKLTGATKRQLSWEWRPVLESGDGA